MSQDMDDMGRGLRYDENPDGDFQRKWREARHLSEQQVELAFRHGLEAQDRFADRPFPEVARYLRQSWEAMATGVPWDHAADIVRSGYSRAAVGDGTIDLAAEALDRFPLRTVGGSTIGGGTVGERNFLGAAEPVPAKDETNSGEGTRRSGRRGTEPPREG